MSTRDRAWVLDRATRNRSGDGSQGPGLGESTPLLSKLPISREFESYHQQTKSTLIVTSRKSGAEARSPPPLGAKLCNLLRGRTLRKTVVDECAYRGFSTNPVIEVECSQWTCAERLAHYTRDFTVGFQAGMRENELYRIQPSVLFG